ncbi:hypothetical protein BpHYR1_009357, partial [Brachionus plicatilis]
YGFVCTAKRITLKSKSNLIFDTCDIKHLESKLKTSFVYWTKETVNFCPYRLCMIIGLNLPFNNVFSNTNGDQIFKIYQTFNECGMKLYGSTESIFLTYNRTNLPKIKADFVTIHDFILADSDGIAIKTYTALDRLKEEICNIVLSSLRTFRHHDDQFEILYAGNKTLVKDTLVKVIL